MNVWYVITLILIGLGIVIIIGSILATIFGIKKAVQIIQAHVERIQQLQVNPLQVQTTQLNAIISRVKMDVDYKKTNLTNVTECFKEVGTSVQQLAASSKYEMNQLIKHVQTDEEKKAQTEKWTNQALGFLKKSH